MTIEELLDEGRRLARPCLYLRPDGDGPIIGYRDGERADIPNVKVEIDGERLRRDHFFTVDSRIFAALDPELQVRNVGWPRDLFIQRDVKPTMKAFHRGPRLTSFDQVECDGTPLRAVPGSSFPPFQAVCLYGSDAVAEWLRSEGFERHEYEAAALQTDLGDEYCQEFFDLGSYYTHKQDIMVGGWHLMWPSNDFYMPREMRLLVSAKEAGKSVWELWLTGRRNERGREQIPGGMA